VLIKVADNVLVHQSRFCQTNAAVVSGPAGVLLVDPGVTEGELTCLAEDLSALGRPVVAGFSTHPHWDHLLWHADLGSAPRYGTARCAATVRERLPDAAAKARVTALMPTDLVDEVPLELLGLIAGLPAGADELAWGGTQALIVEHQAHASGHAALLVEQRRVLLAGDMLSDVLIPLLDFSAAADPIEEYLAGLRLLEDVVADVDVLVPGHGSVARADQIPARIELDRAYLHALRNDETPDDPRLGPAATYPWVADVHERQRQQLAQRS
jgi:glyoxylase-like metal-dependent hydrolase (beta-lactamase superfamily II)